MRNRSVNVFLLATVCGMMTGPASAQQQEFSIAAGGGWQGAHYSIRQGDASSGTGYQLGFGYMRSVHERWGIRTGLELGLYRSKASLDPRSEYTSYEVDSKNSAFEYRVSTNGYHEDQQVWTVNIPLLWQFHPAFNTNGLYAQLGIRMGIPVSSRYTASAGQLRASGYYPDYHLEITDLPVHGFGSQQDWKRKGNYDLKLSWSAAAELGWRLRISANKNLYAGLYLDYGLNNIKKTEDGNNLLRYQAEGLAQSKPAGIFSVKDETGNARLMAYGIKLRIGFGVNRSKQKIETATAPLNPVPAPTARDTIMTPAPVQPELPVVDSVVKTETHVDSLTAGEMDVLETPVLFGKVGDTALSESTRQQVAVIAGVLKKHPELILRIEGHTCNIGSDAANERVGLARAHAVAAALQAEGVEASSLEIISKAHREPLVPNDTESNRKKNRRVVLRIL